MDNNNNEKIEVDLQTNLRRFDEQFSKEVKEIIDKIIPNKILELNRLFHQKDYMDFTKNDNDKNETNDNNNSSNSGHNNKNHNNSEDLDNIYNKGYAENSRKRPR